MPNPRLADRYAKSLIDISTEQNLLDVAHSDMQYLKAVCAQSAPFVQLLQSPIIKAVKKKAILAAVIDSNINEVTRLFIQLLVTKGRESDLPEIAIAFINQYNAIKGIHKVVLTTAIPVSESVQNKLAEKVKTAFQFDAVELEAKVDEKIIGGFVLEFDNNLVDASIVRDLKHIKKAFAQNIYLNSFIY